ncbi:MAG TPA: DUF2087 domain-containing protein [Pseudolysinimonas sp.]|jgi:hypothetical protein
MDDAEPTSEPWRAVLAALVDPRLRRTLAELIVEDDPALSASERREARRILMQSGLLTPAQQLNERGIRSMLKKEPAEEEGVDRWLRADGSVRRWPVSPEDRLELLTWIALRLMGSEEVLAEKPLTQRLVTFTSDPNTLRRALVDAGLLTRNADGSDYRRTSAS